jgi:hypothetical protein
MCYTTRWTWGHLWLVFLSRTGYPSDHARRTLFLLFATLAHDSIDTPVHSLVDLAPKHTQAFPL